MNKHNGRKAPPDDDDDWFHIWDSADKAQKLWYVLGWLHAIATNWKALLVVAAIIVWINSPEVIALIKTLVKP